MDHIININNIDILHTQVAVIGGGGAGLRAALAVAETGAEVILLSKGLAARSGATAMAGAGFQAMGHPQDNLDLVFEDVRREGRFLGDENLIQTMVSDAPKSIEALSKYGIKFLTDKSGKKELTQIPGQALPRNMIIKGNGFAMGIGLRRALEKQANATLLDDMIISSLFLNRGRICGLLALDMRRGLPLLVTAKAIILATGGYHELWRWTDAEPGLTGEGAVLAYQAGADLIDLEMMQFYPTCMCHPPEAYGSCIGYEDLLNIESCGGYLLDGEGKIIQQPSAKLPLRDELMMQIFDEIDAGRGTPHGGVYIDLSRSKVSKEEIKEYLSQQMLIPYNNLTDLNIDIFSQPLEVKPFTHYLMGGIRINEHGETNVPGLFAAGEAGGNVQGANRIGGNGLAESQVFGARAGNQAVVYIRQAQNGTPENLDVQRSLTHLYSFLDKKTFPLRPVDLKRSIKSIMDEYVNHRREEGGLHKALDALQLMRTVDLPRLQVMADQRVFNYEWQEAIEAENMLSLAELVTAGALERQESRGHHRRLDFPNSDPAWCKHIIIERRDDDSYRVKHAPVIRIKPLPDSLQNENRGVN